MQRTGRVLGSSPRAWPNVLVGTKHVDTDLLSAELDGGIFAPSHFDEAL
jgi:hypothetical protein